MNKVKLKTSKQLETFLRVLAEESIGMAQVGMASNEPARQKDITKRMQKDKFALSEEDPEKASPEVADTKQPPDKEEPAPAPTPKDVQTGEINPSLDAVIRAIKEIRSGFGADDSAIEQELSNYFDRLDEAEKISMIVLMRSVGDIMRREAQGAEAPEPSQYNVITSMKPGEESAPAAEPNASSATPVTPSSPPPTSGQEDTAPPIKIGEPVTESYRRKIRDLLSKNRN